MRDTCHYTNIYTTKFQELMFLKEGGSYSFLKMDICEEDPDVKSYANWRGKTLAFRRGMKAPAFAFISE